MKINLTESRLRQIVAESIDNVLIEAKDPTSVINALIQSANEAVLKAVEECEDNYPLMDKNGELYGLNGEIKLDGRGYIIFPFTQLNYGSQSYSRPERIRILTKEHGMLKLVHSDYWTEGWEDAKKILKCIIKDAQRGISHFNLYDPSWEDSETPEEFKSNKEQLRNFNKTIGRKADTGMSYLQKKY